MGIANLFPSTIFFPSSRQHIHSIRPVAVISSFEGMGFNCTKSLALQKAESSQTSLVLSADLCCSQARAAWRGLTAWGNSFSPETEEDKVSCLFSPSHLSLPHRLSQAGFRLMVQWMVFNPCLAHASRENPVNQGTSDTSTGAQGSISWLQNGQVFHKAHYCLLAQHKDKGRAALNCLEMQQCHGWLQHLQNLSDIKSTGPPRQPTPQGAKTP